MIFVENVLREFHHHEVSLSVKRAKDIVNTMAVISAEAERGFSVMNLNVTKPRNQFTVNNISNLIVINMNGLPCNMWNPAAGTIS